jgi:plastocyanin
LLSVMCACGDDASAVDHTPTTDAGASQAGSKASAADAACTMIIKLLDYKLDPKELDANSGEITLCAVNDGQAPHDLAVRDSARKTLGKTKTLGPGESDRFTVSLEAAAYDIYCTQGGHESLGMKGTLTVK